MFWWQNKVWCLFCFVFHVPWLRTPFSVLKIITTENKFGYMWLSQLIPFILYISMCPDKQVQREFLSALKCDIRGIYVHLQWRIRRNHKSPGYCFCDSVCKISSGNSSLPFLTTLAQLSELQKQLLCI